MPRNSRMLARYNADIPTAEDIARFTAPHGFSGIGANCVAARDVPPNAAVVLPAPA